ncbi:MAG: flavin reductase family protein [Acidimicrobiaceae bacterium]|nr:flavin reductase family protein [Acidimicrobiaceae bacterium]MYH78979.1 flavin reductase family protein [Acidimicrobiaceae bacterium]MYK74575.1 flavin reductase family protein [Acidimicrobiaceae bacterium]
MTSGGNHLSDGREFRRVLGHYPTGVTVVTATCPGGPEGLTIGSFTSVSLDPPLVSFCPGHDSDSWARMRAVGSFCVNVLADDQADLSSTFASRAGDKFREVTTRVEATGAPVIEGCLAWIDCRVETVHTAGDHDIVVGRVVALGTADGASESASGPLVFLKGGYGRVAGL